MADFALEGFKWGGSGIGTAGGLVNWAVDATVPTALLYDISSAFSMWSSYANIQFQRVASTTAAAIDFSFGYIDGSNNVLGETSYSYSGSAFRGAAVEFDSGENWRAVGTHGYSSAGVSFYVVALHEIGHAIGLDHYNVTAAVMNAYLSPSILYPTSSDIHGVQTLYGVAQTAGFGDRLVDSGFYFAKYQDVAQSGMTATAHYDNYGWHEGRDPNVFFSTSGYLATNHDVLAAGINPLQHFDQYGWKEGRDPSANFDAQLYLERNPDVRAAGVDPLQHFITNGQAEGRQAFAAVGEANSFTHGSFDAEYYLLKNPDVAKAAISAGGDSFVFAHSHYEQYGWHEGRNPNSVFDVSGYLAKNADVKAAGIDPLYHYDVFGWKEGRDPSATFDTKQYESHYTDVAAAHVDPLLHYLANGIHEGRSSFGDGILS
ncbi:MAG: matrixin family metalloprotease [Pseudomonadota bacterium]